MFTGLVGELGKVASSQKGTKSLKLTISAHDTLNELRIGDSVAVNGACLTVVSMAKDSFTVDVMPQTADNTIIPALKPGDMVNLERTLRVGDRLDGHMVSGHIDCIGKITACKKDDIAILITIALPEPSLRQVVLRGSVAIDGISLTVCALGKDFFSVSLIPHTAKNTTLGFKKEGSLVNIETDVIGKYVERILSFGGTGLTGGSAGLSMASLLENGFLGR